MRAQPIQISVVIVLITALVLACGDEEMGRERSAFQAVFAADPTFETALAAGRVKISSLPIGRMVRPVLRHHAPPLRFTSDPLDVDPQVVLSGAIGIKTDWFPEAEKQDEKRVDQVTFRIEARGPSGAVTLLEKTSITDFPRDEWHPIRIELPHAIGSPITLEFAADFPPGVTFRTPRAMPVWAAPRLLRATDGKLPNVLLVVFDTLRADRTGLYGYERETSPFLDHLGKIGVSLDDLIAPYPSTLTSHWSLFTGLDPPRHGAYPGTLRQNFGQKRETLAGAFQKAGYLTAGFTEGGFVHSLFGFSQGFDVYHDGDGQHFTEFTGTAGDTFARAAAWIREHQEFAFFMFLHTYQVHAPYTPPEKYRALFTSDYGERWATSFPVGAAISINRRQIQVTPAELAHVNALYDAEIRYLDDQFSQLWHELEEMGVLANTLVVITSDHGEDMMEHGWLEHGTTLYDPGLRVPLLLIWPNRLPPGVRLHCQRPLVDLMPTILELVGLRSQGDIDGRSFASEIQQQKCSESRPAHAELKDIDDPLLVLFGDRPSASLRDGEWKLIANLANGENQLYHLTSDPGEQRNLAQKEKARVQEMRSMIESYLAKASPATSESRMELSPEVEKELRSLGYLE
jgi:arylsulfatase A-like enzyme